MIKFFYLAPDKRQSSEQIPTVPKRTQKKSTPSSCSIEYVALDQDGDSISNHTEDNHELRDSGISITDAANLNNFNNSNYEEFDLRAHQQEMNINASPQNGGSPKIENPPPIPPKSSLGFGGSLERHATIDLNSQESYSVPKVHVENGEADKQDESPCWSFVWILSA